MDNFLERVSSKSGAIPEELKSTKNNQLLKSLIEKTEMIWKSWKTMNKIYPVRYEEPKKNMY